MKVGGSLKIILAILIFSLVILFHEFGHFLLAKLNKIVVTEFSLGMGPRLLSFEKNGTKYSLKLLPIGGSCAMLGEDAEDIRPGTFNGASVWSRISVVAAGPIFNFILAFVISSIIVAGVGYDPAKVAQVAGGSAAEEAGLKEGDVITEFNGYHIDLSRDLLVYTYMNELKEDVPLKLSVINNGEEREIIYTPDVNVRYLLGFNRVADSDLLEVGSLIKGMPLETVGVQPGDIITSINNVEIPNDAAYEKYISENPLTDESVTITYLRDGLTYEATVIPAEYRTPVIGFSLINGCEKAKGLSILKYGMIEIKYLVRTTILSLKELFSGSLGMDDLSGPVGVVDAIGDTYENSKDQGTLMIWMNMLNMVVLLSANLGVMNLLPLPALDGGRLVFLIIEAIRRKPTNRTVEGMVHFVGLVLLMGLMVVIMYNDILKLF